MMKKTLLILLLLKASLAMAAFTVSDAQWANLALDPYTTTGGAAGSGTLNGVVDIAGDPGTDIQLTIDPTEGVPPNNYGWTTVYTGVGGIAGDVWNVELKNEASTPFQVQPVAWIDGWGFVQSGIYSDPIEQGVCTNLSWDLSSATSIEAVGLLVIANASDGLSPTVRIISPGLTVWNGALYKDGMPYRGLGVNYVDLFLSMIETPADPGSDFRTLEGLRFLGEQGVPFARFMACGYWPVNWNIYFDDKAEWFRRMDLVVDAAEEAGVGLIPSFFWRYETYPNLMDEYMEAWGDPASQTRQFMSNYVHEVVGRYKDSPAIWGWEFCNEINLYCDLPNWDLWITPENEWAGVTGKVTQVDIRNKMTFAIAESAFNGFAQEVRKLDAHRFITTGNSFARHTSWNNAVNNSWDTDTYSEAMTAFGWMAPVSAIDMASFHVYLDQVSGSYAGALGRVAILNRYREFCDLQNQAMFIGEFSHYFINSGFVPGTAAERANEEALVQEVMNCGADLAAYWVFDYAYGMSQDETGIAHPTNDYRWIVDLVLEYDAKMRGETPRSPAGVPLGWFDSHAIAPAGSATWGETEVLDPNSNGMPTWEDYYAGTHPVNPGPVFAITDFQLLPDGTPSLSWWGGTNGLMTPYIIQANTNLTNTADWQTVGSKTREEGTNIWLDTGPETTPQRSFRILAQPE
ncbi:MAG: hypothetical protein ABFR33_03390 [Verrucomicrobiota bacterium]